MHRCSFLYTGDDTFVFNVDGGLQGRIARIDSNVARIYFVNMDSGYAQSAVPTNMRLHDVVNNSVVPVHHGEFLIVWNGCYELRIGGATVLSLDVERRQAIRTRFDAHSSP